MLPNTYHNLLKTHCQHTPALLFYTHQMRSRIRQHAIQRRRWSWLMVRRLWEHPLAIFEFSNLRTKVKTCQLL